MATQIFSARGRTLRATLCEIERGVFYVTYPDGGALSDIEEVYQVGTSAADAKRQIERIALAAGYEGVTWKDDTTAPLFASCAVHQHPAAHRTVHRLV